MSVSANVIEMVFMLLVLILVPDVGWAEFFKEVQVSVCIVVDSV